MDSIGKAGISQEMEHKETKTPGETQGRVTNMRWNSRTHDIEVVTGNDEIMKG